MKPLEIYLKDVTNEYKIRHTEDKPPMLRYIIITTNSINIW